MSTTDLRRYGNFRLALSRLSMSGRYRNWLDVQAALERDGFTSASEWLKQGNLRTEADCLCDAASRLRVKDGEVAPALAHPS